VRKGVPVTWNLVIKLNDQGATSNRKIGIESAEGVLGLEPACFKRCAGDVVLAQWPSAPQLLREVWWRAVPEVETPVLHHSSDRGRQSSWRIR
jgi:hypothetical protein